MEFLECSKLIIYDFKLEFCLSSMKLSRDSSPARRWNAVCIWKIGPIISEPADKGGRFWPAQYGVYNIRGI